MLSKSKLPKLRRAVAVSLKFAMECKRQVIAALLAEYRATVNCFIHSLWQEKGQLDAETLNRLPDTHTRLSARYKSQALRQAFIVIATCNAAKALKQKVKVPQFRELPSWMPSL